MYEKQIASAVKIINDVTDALDRLEVPLNVGVYALLFIAIDAMRNCDHSFADIHAIFASTIETFKESEEESNEVRNVQ
jgi:hypothetical protein